MAGKHMRKEGGFFEGLEPKAKFGMDLKNRSAREVRVSDSQSCEMAQARRDHEAAVVSLKVDG